MKMQITAGIKQKGVTAFMPHKENFYHWCEKRNRFQVVEHRGFICESENASAALGELLNMVRAANPELSNLVMEDVKYLIAQ